MSTTPKRFNIAKSGRNSQSVRHHHIVCLSYASHLADLFFLSSLRVLQSKKGMAPMPTQTIWTRTILIPSLTRAKTKTAKSSLLPSTLPSYARSHASRRETRASTTLTAMYSRVRLYYLQNLLATSFPSAHDPHPYRQRSRASLERYLPPLERRKPKPTSP